MFRSNKKPEQRETQNRNANNPREKEEKTPQFSGGRGGTDPESNSPARHGKLLISARRHSLRAISRSWAIFAFMEKKRLLGTLA